MGSLSSTCQRDDRKAVVETIVCKYDEIPENGMKEFPSGPNNEKILLVKQCGKIYAVSNLCTHYGAPLVTGALGDGRVRCPWHGACFDLKTGDIEDFPGLDSLHCYNVTVDKDGLVKLKGVRDTFTSKKRIKTMVRKDCGNHQQVVVIGGGVAASKFVETIRQEGFTGGVTVLCKEKYLPYDRVKCNKKLDVEYDKVVLRSEDFYRTNNINMMLSEEVVSVDTQNRSLKTAKGLVFQFDNLFLACGVKAREIPDNIPGRSLRNIFTVRNLDDSMAIHKVLEETSDIVVVGSSFIAMETASYCVDKVKSVTVIGNSKVPFQAILGEKIGKRIMELFESKGVVMKMKTSFKAFEGENGTLRYVVLADGTKLPADICIVGIGAQQTTKFLDGSGVNVNKDGSVEVDEYLKTNVPFVYAGGDVANAPVFSSGNKKFTIGHFQLAQYHGHIAALNIAGKCTPSRAVPFFFSNMLGKGLRYAGHASDYDDIVIEGSLQDMKFAAFYCKGDVVEAVGSIGADPIVAQYAELIYNEKTLKKSEIATKKWAINLSDCS